MGNFCYAQGIECTYATTTGQCKDYIFEDYGLCAMLGDDMPPKDFSSELRRKWCEDWFRLRQTAKAIARNAHNGQIDKAGKPYIEHPLAVANMMDDPAGEIVALLHDVLEDSDYTASDLYEAGFPKDIVGAVCALTRENGESRSHYIHRVKENPLATRVKLADLRHNMDLSRLPSVSDEDRKRTEMYRKEYEALMK